jgi:hypothetical protein
MPIPTKAGNWDETYSVATYSVATDSVATDSVAMERIYRPKAERRHRHDRAEPTRGCPAEAKERCPATGRRRGFDIEFSWLGS